MTKVKKVKKYMQKYKDEYSKQFSCIVKSSKSDEHANCTICSADTVYLLLTADEAISMVNDEMKFGVFPDTPSRLADVIVCA